MTERRILNTGLCIGGPAAGRKVDSDAPYYRVAVLDPLPASAFLSSEIMPALHMTRTVVTYRREKICCEQGDIIFWMPEGQTMLETLEKIFEGYENFAIEEGAE